VAPVRNRTVCSPTLILFLDFFLIDCSGVAMLHKLPVVLKVNVAFPSVDRNDETFVLPAFQKLVNLFWIFDQSGAFDILQDSDAGIFGLGDIESPNRTCLDLLQRQLGEIPVESESINDIQTADICVTRQWMRAVLWKFSVNHGLLSSASADQAASLYYPLQIAREFLSMISHIPNSAIEVHGQGIVSISRLGVTHNTLTSI
jgi:hypothetical protein